MTKISSNPRVTKKCSRCRLTKEHYVLSSGKTVSGCVDCQKIYGKINRQKMLSTNRGRLALSEHQSKYSKSHKGRERAKRAYQKHRQKFTARRAVSRAVKNGSMKRPDQCSGCGDSPGPMKDGRPNIQAHHHKGYSKKHRLDVVWLCRKCHEHS